MINPDRSQPSPTEASPLLSQKGPDWWLMLRKFFQRGRVIASVAPSSRYLVTAILKGINFDTARCIVELGAGTGPITAELLRRAKPHTRVVILELDPDLCARLRKRFPDADIIEGDAAELGQILEERGIETVDHILSGLPLPSIPGPIRDRILDVSARRLHPEGSFRQLTVMPWVYYKLYRKYFSEVRFSFVFRNLPPGGVYICKGW
jgi:phospholipid N-methyltransferase